LKAIFFLKEIVCYWNRIREGRTYKISCLGIERQLTRIDYHRSRYGWPAADPERGESFFFDNPRPSVEYRRVASFLINWQLRINGHTNYHNVGWIANYRRKSSARRAHQSRPKQTGLFCSCPNFILVQ